MCVLGLSRAIKSCYFYNVLLYKCLNGGLYLFFLINFTYFQVWCLSCKSETATEVVKSVRELLKPCRLAPEQGGAS